MNRHGIRMGSADIYQAVERLPEVAEALVIGVEQSDGGYWMPLFVVLADDAELTEELQNRIKRTIREEVSPRHVPDEILVAPGCSAHPHRQEARGSDKEAAAGCRSCAGRGAHRRRQPGNAGLVREPAALVEPGADPA